MTTSRDVRLESAEDFASAQALLSTFDGILHYPLQKCHLLHLKKCSRHHQPGPPGHDDVLG